MALLEQNIKEEIIRLLGYQDYETVTPDNIAKLDREFSEANVKRINQIIDLITREPEMKEDGCLCGGGIDYQLDNAGIDSNVQTMEKFSFDHTGMIKRLVFSGKKLTNELSNIVRIPIHYNRYGAALTKPVAFVSFPN